MACRSAVMAGDRLSEEQAAELLRRAGEIDTSQSCAHGRPTVLRIPYSDLLRHFKSQSGVYGEELAGALLPREVLACGHRQAPRTGASK